MALRGTRGQGVTNRRAAAVGILKPSPDTGWRLLPTVTPRWVVGDWKTDIHQGRGSCSAGIFRPLLNNGVADLFPAFADLWCVAGKPPLLCGLQPQSGVRSRAIPTTQTLACGVWPSERLGSATHRLVGGAIAVSQFTRFRRLVPMALPASAGPPRRPVPSSLVAALPRGSICGSRPFPTAVACTATTSDDPLGGVKFTRGKSACSSGTPCDAISASVR